VRVHSLTLPFTLGLPLLARNLTNPCFGRKPKARVATLLHPLLTLENEHVYEAQRLFDHELQNEFIEHLMKGSM
jgi:hypothetical protein